MEENKLNNLSLGELKSLKLEIEDRIAEKQEVFERKSFG